MRRHALSLTILLETTFGLPSRAPSPPSYLSLALYSSLSPIPRWTASEKRQDVGEEPDIPEPVSVLLRDASYIHFMPLTLGTPPQPMLVSVDTGSWQFWVNPNCTTAPALQQALCQANGHYDVNASSTATEADGEGEVLMYSPGGGSFATVNYFTDVLRIGGNASTDKGAEGAASGILEVEGMRIGVANGSVGLGNGIIGLGPHPDPEIGFSEPDAGNGTLGGVLGALHKEGLIASRAYGMDLVKRGEGSNGAIVFGGLDRNRFSGPLFKVNITPPADAPTNTARFWARVKTISTLENGTDPVPLDTPYQDYVLDSGTTFSFLPKVMVDTLVESLNATLDVSSGLVTVDCVKVDEGTDMAAIFEFEGGENGGGTVTVPYEKFIIDARGLNGGGLGCVLGVGELVGVVGEDVTPVLGVGFMKTVYTVFDLDNVNIHMAQGASCGEPDIVAIGSGEGAVPLVEGNC